MSISNIRKRDGRTMPFDREKIPRRKHFLSGDTCTEGTISVY